MPGKWVFPGGRIDRRDYYSPTATELSADVAEQLSATARLSRQNGARLARALAQAAVRETYEETGLIIGNYTNNTLHSDLSGLSYIARAITPPARHKRFDARFLLAEATCLCSLEPTDSRELNDLAWFTTREARELDLPTVTRAVLDVVDLHIAGTPPPEIPFWRWTRTNAASAI